MNNAGTVLLTVADMSVIEAEVEVDETDIPFVKLGQAAKVKIDAIPDKTFTGKVTEIGNSPIQTTGTGTTRTATNFKVTVQVDDQIPDVRPGFTCTADITTATRQQALAVPIQAMTVRELHYDAQGNIIHDVRPPKPGFRFGPAPPASVAAPVELKPGEKREEKEGVFLMKDGKAEFVIVKTGIAGERYLEVQSGLKEGDQVITGPFDSVRGMVVVNRLDRERASLDRTLESLRMTLNRTVIPIQLPIGEERSFTGVVDLVGMPYAGSRKKPRSIRCSPSSLGSLDGPVHHSIGTPRDRHASRRSSIAASRRRWSMRAPRTLLNKGNGRSEIVQQYSASSCHSTRGQCLTC